MGYPRGYHWRLEQLFLCRQIPVSQGYFKITQKAPRAHVQEWNIWFLWREQVHQRWSKKTQKWKKCASVLKNVCQWNVLVHLFQKRVALLFYYKNFLKRMKWTEKWKHVLFKYFVRLKRDKILKGKHGVFLCRSLIEKCRQTIIWSPIVWCHQTCNWRSQYPENPWFHPWKVLRKDWVQPQPMNHHFHQSLLKKWMNKVSENFSFQEFEWL